MTALLFLHIFFMAAWVGCILVEALYEHSIAPTPEMRRFVSELHWRTDTFIEIPAFLAVLLTGGALLHAAPMNGVLWTKVACGLIAIAVNTGCVWLVLARLRAARANNFATWEKLDHWQHKLGAVVLLALLAALTLGGWELAGR